MVFEKVQKIISENLNVPLEKVTMDTHLVDDLGADSLDAVELIMALEEEYGIEVDDEAAQNMKYVRDLVELCKRSWKNINKKELNKKAILDKQVSLSIIAFYIFKTIESKKFKQCKKY